MDTIVRKDLELSLKNVCIDFLFAYQQQNVDRMLNCCSMDGIIHFIPMGEEGKGNIHQLGKAIWEALIIAFPDIQNTLDAAVAENEHQVRCQVLISGTQKSDFAGITSNGKRFDSDHIFIFRIGEDKKINSITVNWDHEDFQRQLK